MGFFLSFTSHAFAANRYWVGGCSTTNWSCSDAGPVTNWGSVSNTRDNVSVPGASDDVFFDGVGTGNSPSTLSASQSVKSLDMTGYANTLTHSAAVTLTVAGNGVVFKLASGMTYTLSNAATAAITFTGTSGTTLITTAGKTLGNITFNGTGGTFQLQDEATTTGIVFSRTNGTFDPNGHTVAFTGAGTVVVTSVPTFYNLTRTGTAFKTDIISFTTNSTITNTLTLNGNSNINRLLVQSNTIGTSITLTASTTAIYNSDFRDITGAGTGNWDLHAITGLSGDALGNSGITFTASTTNYWVADTGNWSDVTKWKLSDHTSAGRVPLPQDDVRFDASSFTAGSKTVTTDMPRGGRSIDWTGTTNTPVWNASLIVTMYGSLTLISNMTPILSNIKPTLEGRGSYTLTNAGKTGAYFNVQMSGGTLTLQDDLSGNILNVNNGTFNANNHNVSLSSGFSAGITTSPRTINMGSGIWTMDGTGSTWNTNATNFTMNADTSTIVISNTSATFKNFVGSGKTYNNVTFSGDNITVIGSNTFNTLAVNNAGLTNGLKFTSGTTQTINNFTTNGSAGNLAKLSATPSGIATLSKSSGTIAVDYMSIASSTATGGATWYAGANSINVGNNTGWIFNSPGSLPIVSVQAASSTTSFTTTLNGSIDSTGGTTVTVRGFEYGTTTSYGTTSQTTGSYSTDSFTSNIENLLCNTLYHYRSFATNTVGTSSSTDTTFTTSACPTTWYVSPTGTNTNNGSIDYPWSLAFTLSGVSGMIQPGDTVYLRGGTYTFPVATLGYTSTLTGTANSPIVVRSYPNEWAVIDGNLNGVATKNTTMLIVNGAYTWYRDFEMTNSEIASRKIAITGSNPPERRGNSIDDYGLGTKFINLIIHDTGQGFGTWSQGSNNEYYGNIVFNNGWDAPDRGHGKGFYSQNTDGYKRIQNNILFNDFSGVTLRSGGTDSAHDRGLYYEGNILFNGTTAMEGPDFVDLKIFQTYTWNHGFGVGNEPDNSSYHDAEVRQNYFTTSATLFDFFQGLIFKNNTIINTSDLVGRRTLSIGQYPEFLTTDYNTIYNTYYNSWPYWALRSNNHDYAFNKTQGNQVTTYGYVGAPYSWQDDLGFDLHSTFYDAQKTPASNVIYYRKNKYDPNLLSVLVYNWAGNSSVSVDPSLVLANGNTYEIHSVQNYFGDITTGTYSGSPISVSMTERSFAKPIGYDAVGEGNWYHDPLYANGTTTFPGFGAFVIKNTTGTTDTVAPVISTVTNDTVSTSTAVVFWNTNEDSTTHFEYGPTTSYGTASTTDDSSYNTPYTTFHEISLAGLSPGTIYHYRLTDVDYAGNSTVSGDYTFTTTAPPDTIPPIIINISSDKANGSYTTGEVIDIDVTFSEAVTSTGLVTVTLETGTTDRTCTFSITNSTTGTCNYTVQSGDTSSDLTVNTISGTIVDQASNPMTDFVPSTNLAANKAIVIDTTNPTTSSLSPTDNATGVSVTANLILTFNEAVTANTGNITIKKTSDNSTVETIDVTTGQVTGSGTTTITVNPSVTLESLTEYYVLVASTAFRDVALNSYAGISSTTVWSFTVGDVGAPTITSVSSDKANGSYTTGEVIDINVTFSEAVTSTGSVTVTLETGVTDRTCTFSITNSTTGTCNYTVQAGDTSSDLTVSSISGTIADQSANPMTDFVPATNLAANKAIVIDTTGPTISELTPVTTPTNDNTPSYTFTTDEAGTIIYGGDCTSATSSASSGSNTITFSSLSDGTHSNCTIRVTDTATNQSNLLAVTAFTVDTSTPDTTAHTITASTGANGSISPSGSVSVNDGENQIFTITPNSGYHINTVTVDSGVVSATSPYTFTNVTADHTISATFAADAVVIPVVSRGRGGSLIILRSTICPVGNLFSVTSGLPCTSYQTITTNPSTNLSQTTYNFGITTLRLGSKGTAVKELQRFLNDKLNLGLVLDGKLGSKTVAVIKKWQKAHGLVADGLVGKKTKEKMNAEK